MTDDEDDKRMLRFIDKVSSWSSERRRALMDGRFRNGLFAEMVGLTSEQAALILACAAYELPNGVWFLGRHYLPVDKRRACQDCYHADWDDDGELVGCLWREIKRVPPRMLPDGKWSKNIPGNAPLMRSARPDAWYARALRLGAANDDGTIDTNKIADVCVKYEEDV